MSSPVDRHGSGEKQLEDEPISTSKTGKQIQRKIKTKMEQSRTVGQLQKYSIYVKGISEGEEREKGKEEIFVVVMIENCPKLLPEPNHISRKLTEHQPG